MAEFTEGIYLVPLDMVEFVDYLREKKQYKPSSASIISRSANTLLYKRVNLVDLNALNQIIIESCIKKRTNLVYHAIKNIIEFKFEDLLREDPTTYKGLRAVKEDILKGLIKAKQFVDRKKQSKTLTDNQIIELSNYLVQDKHKLILILQSLTGARVGDIMHLKLEDIQPDDVDGEEVLKLNTLSKGGKRIIHFLFDDYAQTLLLNYALKEREDTYDGYIFLDSHFCLNRSNVSVREFVVYETNYIIYWKELKKALMHMGIEKKDFSTHDVRRSFAKKAWSKYKDVNILKLLMHHQDVKTSMRYLQTTGLDTQEYQREMQN
jgi:integrase